MLLHAHLQRGCLAAPTAAARPPSSMGTPLQRPSLAQRPLLRCTCPPQHSLSSVVLRRQRYSSVAHSSKAGDMIRDGNQKYVSKDLMAALKLYEEAMDEKDVTARQLQAALYGCTAVHAAFGDVELAQMTLRDAISQGLDFEQAIQDPDMPDLQASPQIIIQLKRFNSNAQAALTRVRSRPAASARSSSTSSSSSSSSRGSFGNSMKVNSALDQDLGSILGTPTSDKAAIDTSVGGIIRRVLLLLLALSALGGVLFFLGLEYMFPQY